MVFLQFRQRCSFGNSSIETAQLVNQLDAQGILSNPYVSLCNLFHLFGGHLASLCHTLTEQLVAAFDISFEISHFFG